LRVNRKTYLFLSLAMLLGVLIGSAVAAQPTPPSASLLGRGTLGPIDAEHQGVEVERDHSADHAVAEITFPPGSSTGWHDHPGVVLVTVTSGRLQFIDENCEREVFEAGESFVEAGDPGLARNRGSVDTVVIATWVLPTKAEALTVPVDPPKGCRAR
jgi:quercetin dioxygenase-like cupin family protein